MYDWRDDWQNRFGRTEPKIVCVGLNYTDHAAEQGAKLPANPMLFAKFANALCGDGEDIVLPPASGTWTRRPSSPSSSAARRTTSPPTTRWTSCTATCAATT